MKTFTLKGKSPMVVCLSFHHFSFSFPSLTCCVLPLYCAVLVSLALPLCSCYVLVLRHRHLTRAHCLSDIFFKEDCSFRQPSSQEPHCSALKISDRQTHERFVTCLSRTSARLRTVEGHCTSFPWEAAYTPAFLPNLNRGNRNFFFGFPPKRGGETHP
jgi:hypothetical protein